MIRYSILMSLLFMIKIQAHMLEDRHMQEKQKINYTIRKGCTTDRNNLKELYIKVASIPGGLVRSADEITDGYIDFIMNATQQKGFIFVAEYENKLIGAVVKYKTDIKALSHVIDEGSVLVDPEYQGIGIGTQLYITLLSEIKEKYPDILRVNLKVRASNPVIRMYQRLGFQKEAEFEKLIRGVNGELESVIAMVWINPNFKEYQS
jgi:ribosomal protein S18 acetylase RimI-like enzyme